MIKTIQLTTEIKEILFENTREKVISVEALSGGDINYVYKCKLENQTIYNVLYLIMYFFSTVPLLKISILNLGCILCLP